VACPECTKRMQTPAAADSLICANCKVQFDKMQIKAAEAARWRAAETAASWLVRAVVVENMAKGHTWRAVGGEASDEVGLGRCHIVALYCRSSTSYHIH
jgi:hypothetical protein